MDLLPVEELPDGYMDRLFRQYAEMIRRYVLRRTSNAELAEDITSETFERALRSRLAPSHPNVEAWLLLTAGNLLADYRRRRASKDLPMCDFQDGVLPPLASHEQAVAEHHGLVAAYSQIQPALSALTPEQRECLTLRFQRELSVADTAKAMNKSQNAVKVLQHRALRSVRRLSPGVNWPAASE